MIVLLSHFILQLLQEMSTIEKFLLPSMRHFHLSLDNLVHFFTTNCFKPTSMVRRVSSPADESQLLQVKLFRAHCRPLQNGPISFVF